MLADKSQDDARMFARKYAEAPDVLKSQLAAVAADLFRAVRAAEGQALDRLEVIAGALIAQRLKGREESAADADLALQYAYENAAREVRVTLEKAAAELELAGQSCAARRRR